jgi:hypothetical protein
MIKTLHKQLINQWKLLLCFALGLLLSIFITTTILKVWEPNLIKDLIIWGFLSLPCSLTLYEFFIRPFDWEGLKRKPSEIPYQNRWDTVYFALPSFSIWILYLAAFWPGIMSVDSVVQWTEAHTGVFTGGHPPSDTMMLWLMYHIIDNPAFVSIVQLTALSLVAGYGFAEINKLGVRRWLVWIASLVFAIWPTIGILAVTHWKDIHYSIAFLLVSIFVLKIVVTKGEWLESKKNLIVFGFTCLFVPLTRHNGIFIFLLGPILALIFRIKWKSLLLVSVTILAVYLLIIGPGYKVAKAMQINDKKLALVTYWVPIYFMEAQLHAGTPLLPEEKQLLNSIYPVDPPWPYYEYGTYQIEGFNWDVFWVNRGEFLKITLNLMLRNPKSAIKALAMKSNLIWNVTEPQGCYLYISMPLYDTNYKPTYITNQEYMAYKVIPSPKFKNLWLALAKMNMSTRSGSCFIWRPAIYLYLYFAVIILVLLKTRKGLWLLLSVPILMHTVLLIVVNYAQDFRYMFPAILSCLLFWPLVFMPKPAKTELVSRTLQKP